MPSISVPTAIAIGAGVSGAGAIAGAALSGSAATSAAQTQASASDYAEQLQAQEAQQALQFQEGVYGIQQQEAAPWISAGQGAVSTLQNLMGVPSGAGVSGALSALSPSTAAAAAANSATPAGGTVSGLGSPATPGVSGIGRGGTMMPVTGTSAPGTFGSSLGAINTNAPFTLGTQAVNSPAATAAAIEGLTPTGSTGIPSTSPGPQGGQTKPGSVGNLGAQNQSAALASSALGGNTGTGSLLQGWTTPFVAPTAAQAEQYPGEQFQLQQGMQALQQSALAQGNLLTGGTGKALEQYGQGLASTDYQNVYNNAMQQYQQAYNVFSNNQANTFNRLASLSGIGQTSAGQLNSAGSSAASGVANTLLTSGAQQGQAAQNAAAATASGYVGAANAYGGALSSLGSNASSALTLQALLGNSASGVPALNMSGSDLYSALGGG